MDAANRLHLAVIAALLALLQPLARLVLRYRMPFSAFEELAKHAYVKAAMEDFALPGRKPTISRASILTGLTRKEVQRLLAQPEPVRAASDEAYNRAARVVTGWMRDAEFQDALGQPSALDPHDAARGFGALVRRYSGDMPARAVLDELLNVGAVTLDRRGRVHLLRRAYVPSGGEAETLDILGSDVADLITTIDHNLQHGAEDPRFQRKVMYRRVTTKARQRFREFSARRAQQLLEELDAWLAAHGDDDAPETPEEPLVRLGLGIYYFEALSVPEGPKEA